MPSLSVDSLPPNLRDLPILTAADRAAQIPNSATNAQVVLFDASNPLSRPFRMTLSEHTSSQTLTTPTIAGAFKSTTSTLTGAGAVPLTSLVTKIVTTGANALTLADGTDGQLKVLVMKTDGGDGTLTPATKTGFSTITFNDVGDSCLLLFTTTTGWTIVGQNGCTVA